MPISFMIIKKGVSHITFGNKKINDDTELQK